MINVPDNKVAIRVYCAIVILLLPLLYFFGLLASFLLSVKDGVKQFAHMFSWHQRESLRALNLAFKALTKSLKSGVKNKKESKYEDD